MIIRLILLFFIIHTYSSGAVSEVYPSWYPKVSCERKWVNTKNNGHYDFESDVIISNKGNLGYEAYKNRVERETCLKDWTVLIYMAADNDLSPYALWDLHEMESRLSKELNLGASTEKVDVIVELDTIFDTGVRRLHVFQTEQEYRSDLSLREYEKMDERFIRSPVVKWFPEKGPGRVQSAEARFKKFLSWSVQNYPAKKYMVIVWGHGEGFLGQFHEASFKRSSLVKQAALDIPLERESKFFEPEDFLIDSFLALPEPKAFSLEKQFGGIAFDYSDQSFIDVTSLGNILKDWKEKLLEGKNWDFLAFDACLMQSLEVIGEVSSATNFIAGSNQIQNYLGLPYKKLLDELNGGATSYEIAKALPLLTRASWGQEGYQGSVDPRGLETFTMSTLASWQIENNLYLQLHKLAVQLKNYLSERPSRRDEFLFMLENAPRFQGDMIDVGLFYGLIEKLLWQEELASQQTPKSQMLQQKVASGHQKLREVFIESQFGSLYYDDQSPQRSGYLLGYFNGMSLWLPKSASLYHARKDEMRKSALFRSVSSWNDLLGELYKLQVFDFGPL